MFAVVDLSAETTLIEYSGRLITPAQARRIYGRAADPRSRFLLTLNDRYIVDANVGGNSARWINHSCAPNCLAYILEEDRGRADKAFIATLRPICAGEELTFDYRIRVDAPLTQRLKELWACNCGAPECTGTMLAPPGYEPVRRGDATPPRAM